MVRMSVQQPFHGVLTAACAAGAFVALSLAAGSLRAEVSTVPVCYAAEIGSARTVGVDEACAPGEVAAKLEATGLKWRGEWSAKATYALNDAVSYKGSSFIALKMSKAVKPADKTAWGVIALKGEAGERGAAGAKGDAGPAGPVGKTGQTGKTGLQGVAGPRGEKGDLGAEGLQGPAGPQGEQGPAGVLDPGDVLTNGYAVSTDNFSWKTQDQVAVPGMITGVFTKEAGRRLVATFSTECNAFGLAGSTLGWIEADIVVTEEDGETVIATLAPTAQRGDALCVINGNQTPSGSYRATISAILPPELSGRFRVKVLASLVNDAREGNLGDNTLIVSF